MVLKMAAVAALWGADNVGLFETWGIYPEYRALALGKDVFK